MHPFENVSILAPWERLTCHFPALNTSCEVSCQIDLEKLLVVPRKRFHNILMEASDKKNGRRPVLPVSQIAGQ